MIFFIRERRKTSTSEGVWIVPLLLIASTGISQKKEPFPQSCTKQEYTTGTYPMAARVPYATMLPWYVLCMHSFLYAQQFSETSPLPARSWGCCKIVARHIFFWSPFPPPLGTLNGSSSSRTAVPPQGGCWICNVVF